MVFHVNAMQDTKILRRITGIHLRLYGAKPPTDCNRLVADSRLSLEW